METVLNVESLISLFMAVAVRVRNLSIQVLPMAGITDVVAHGVLPPFLSAWLHCWIQLPLVTTEICACRW